METEKLMKFRLVAGGHTTDGLDAISTDQLRELASRDGINLDEQAVPKTRSEVLNHIRGSAQCRQYRQRQGASVYKDRTWVTTDPNAKTHLEYPPYVVRVNAETGLPLIESYLDLQALFGRTKFERVRELEASDLGTASDDAIFAEAARRQAKAPKKPVAPSERDLENLTAIGLKDYAEENEIDLGDAKTKAEMLAAIRAALVPA